MGEYYFMSDNKKGSEPRRPPQGLDPDEQPERQLSMSCHGQVSKNMASVDQGIKLIAAKVALGDMETLELIRNFTGILNKLSPSTFATLLQQVLVLKIDTEVKLCAAVDLIYEKAINEPKSTEACAYMCRQMTTLRVASDEATTSKEETIEFRKVLLSKCQTEFEKNRFDKEQLLLELKKKETNDADLASQLKKEEKLAGAKFCRRKFGNIRFIGELFKLRMLTENIMHNAIRSLFKARDEDHLESLCLLLTMIGKDIDHQKSKGRMDQYFEQILKIIKETRISSRVLLILQDVYDLRMRNWELCIVAPAVGLIKNGQRQQNRMGSSGHVWRKVKTPARLTRLDPTKIKLKANQFEETEVKRPQKQVLQNEDLLGPSSSCSSAVCTSNEGKGSSVHKVTAKCTPAERSPELTQTSSTGSAKGHGFSDQSTNVKTHVQTESIHVPLQVSSCAQVSSQMAAPTLKQQEAVPSPSANLETGEPALHGVPHKEDSKSDRMDACSKMLPKEGESRPSTSMYEFSQWKAASLRKPDTSYNKNTVDKEEIYGLVCYINNQSDYFTTNSRSGQILVCSENFGTAEFQKSTSGTIDNNIAFYTSSTTADSNNVIQALKNIEVSSKLVFKPFSLDVLCRTLGSAKILLKAAAKAGLQNPGISFGRDERVIVVFIRGLVCLEVPVTNAQGKRLTSDMYIEYITEVANKKLEDDLKMIQSFENNLMSASGDQKPEVDLKDKPLDV